MALWLTPLLLKRSMMSPRCLGLAGARYGFPFHAFSNSDLPVNYVAEFKFMCWGSLWVPVACAIYVRIVNYESEGAPYNGHSLPLCLTLVLLIHSRRCMQSIIKIYRTCFNTTSTQGNISLNNGVWYVELQRTMMAVMTTIAFRLRRALVPTPAHV